MDQGSIVNRKTRRMLEAKRNKRVRTRKAWVSAEKLSLGDKVVTKDGRIGRIKSVQPVGGLNTVHNFAVDQHHTYFVGEGQGVWVHNSYKIAVDDVISSKDPAFAKFLEDNYGVSGSETLSTKDMATAISEFMRRGTDGMNAEAGTEKIRSNLTDHLDVIGADARRNGYGKYEGNWASALAQNEAIIGVYAAISMTTPEFQWADLGIYVAQQVREELIYLHDNDVYDPKSMPRDPFDIKRGYNPADMLPKRDHYHADSGVPIVGKWSDVFDKTFSIQRTIVLDLAPLALGYKQYGAVAMRNTFHSTSAAYQGFDLLARADRIESSNASQAKTYRMRAAQQFGLHEQSNVQRIWNTMKWGSRLNSWGGLVGAGVSTNIRIRGRFEIGEIDAPGRTRGNTSSLDYRVDIANHGFEWMLENVHNNHVNTHKHRANLNHFISGRISSGR